MLHDQNYVFKCLGGLLCYQITLGKYQRLEKATQRPAKARLKSIPIVYIRFQMLFQSGWRHMRLASSLKNVLLNDQVIIKELP